MQFRRDIQGMRAIAVLAVFIFHLNPAWLPGGFIGVDIFFVISGYLISSIVLSRIEKDKFSFLEFYGSRIKRIAPAYYVMLLVVMAATAFVSFNFDLDSFRVAFKYSALFLSNKYFSGLDTYFGAKSAENPFLHTWTLAIEMQFYLFLPFILFFLRNRKWILPIIIILTIGLFTYGSIEIFALHHKNEMYFSLLARAPEFLLGVIVALIPAEKIKLKEKGAFWMSIFALLLIIGSTIFITEHSAFPGILAAVPCVGAGLLILVPQNKIRSLLAMEAPFLIGDWSYSIYLWHWPIMALMRYHLDIEIFNFWQYIFVIAATIVLSLGSYYLVEHPLRKTKGKILYPIVAILFAATFPLKREAAYLNGKFAKNNLENKYIAPTFGLASYNAPQIEIFGDLSKQPQILLAGSSHALNMKPYLDYIGKKNNFSFNTIAMSFFPPIIEGIPDGPFKADAEPYYEKYKTIVEFAKQEKLADKSKIIILQMYLDQFGTSLLENNLSGFLENLRPDQTFILLSDFPEINKHPIKANDRRITKEKGAKNKFEKIENPISAKILQVIAKYPNAHILDLSQTTGYRNSFADAPFYNDTIMYYDDKHLNIYGSLKYAQETEKDFMQKLDSILSLHNDIKLNDDSIR